MKKQENITVRYCDCCKKKIDLIHIQYECEGCQYDMCEKCMDKNGHIYLKTQDMDQESIYVVCNKCNEKPPTEKTKEFVDFFKAIGKLGKAEIKRQNKYGDMVSKYRYDNMPKD